MELLRIETPKIAHFAYVLEDEGEAIVIDPRRDVDDYLQAARKLGARIKYVLETHRQEDFVLGSAHLAQRTGAQMVTGTHEIFGHGDIRLDDGDTLTVGTLKLRALHTPGHTPESMSYAIYTQQNSEQAWGVLTGDALFFGTTGRTDLPDVNKSVENAALLYDSIHLKIAPLGDTALVLPAHGPGSVCGSGMASLPFSTIGSEKRYNEVFTLDKEGFSKKKGSERLPRPPYFRLMEEVNRRGGLAPTIYPGDVPLVAPSEVSAAKKELLIDTREPEGFANGHIAGAYSIWTGGLPVFGGWIAERDTPIYLITESDNEVDQAVQHLSRIGIDGVVGALRGGFGSWRESGQPIERTEVITPRELREHGGEVQLLDVRDEEEFNSGHIPAARNVYVGRLPDDIKALNLRRDRPVVVTCSVGHRAGLAASILSLQGFSDVRNLLGGVTAWQELGYPVKR